MVGHLPSMCGSLGSNLGTAIATREQRQQGVLCHSLLSSFICWGPDSPHCLFHPTRGHHFHFSWAPPCCPRLPGFQGSLSPCPGWLAPGMSASLSWLSSDVPPVRSPHAALVSVPCTHTLLACSGSSLIPGHCGFLLPTPMALGLN